MPQSTNDAKEARGLFALFKGISIAGKSVGAYSFPSSYIFDLDRKMPAIAKKHFPGKEIHWDVFDDCFQVGAKMKYLIDFYPYVDEIDAAANNHNLDNTCPYETIVLDSITALSQMALKTIDDVKGQDVYSMVKNVKTSKQTGAKTVEMRSWDSYQAEGGFIKEVLDKAKFLWARPGNPKHVIIIAHVFSFERTDPDTRRSETIRRIVTAGKEIAAYIPTVFDEKYHFYGEPPNSFSSETELSYYCITQSAGDDNASTAYALPEKLVFTDTFKNGKLIKSGSLYDVISDHVDIGRPKSF